MTLQKHRHFPKTRQLLRSPLGAVGSLLLLLVILTAVFAPILLGEAASRADTNALQLGPSWSHLFGTDALGRDILLRTLVATRLSISLALLATVMGVVIGVILGSLPSILPKRLGNLVVSLIDIAVAFPALLLALFFAVIFGVGITGAVLAIGLAGAPVFARVTHTLAASVAGRDFVAAARVSGISRLTVLFRHVLPNIGDPLVVNATIGAGSALLGFASLSFLGIGVQAPSFDWGRIFGEGLALIYENPMAALGPGISILIAGLAFNLLGEAAAQVISARSPMSRVPETPERSSKPLPTEVRDDARVVSVRQLRVGIPSAGGWLWPVRDVDFDILRGQSVGLVGESGSGKSMTAMALSQLIEEPSMVSADRLEFAGDDLLTPTPQTRRTLGTGLAVVFQDPMSSFNPSQRIGRQLAEVSTEHAGLTRKKALERAVDRLGRVKIEDAARRARQLPHEFSGGMRQRAMIAMGLMGEPRLIVADEPTTALDVTVQAQVLELLDEAKRDRDAALLLISHDIDLVARHCDRIMVMYAGRIVEDMPATSLGLGARHPYTRALQAAIPTFETPRDVPLAVIPGRPPRLTEIPPGCAFADRCLNVSERCRQEDPALSEVAVGHRVACWNPVATGSNAYEAGLIDMTDAR